MKRILCILFLLLVLPAVVFAEGEALPPEVQQALDEPGITAEEFQQASLGEMLGALFKTARQQFEKPVRLLVQLLGAALLARRRWPLRRRETGPGRWKASVCWACSP